MAVQVLVSQDEDSLLRLSLDQESPEKFDEKYATITLDYLNEGGANIILAIHSMKSQCNFLTGRLDGKLLRSRKTSSKALPTIDQLHALQKHFVPLFHADQFVQSELVRIDQGVLEAIQKALPLMSRPITRINDTIIQNEPHALFVSDMRASATHDDNSVLQFKPKWLSQSPNAPPNAKRCRTCALRAYRVSRGHQTATDKQEFCPLQLTSTDPDDRTEIGARLTTNRRLVKWFVCDSQQLLDKLKYWQQAFDTKGVLQPLIDLGGDDQVHDICKAMTLRDCTIYLRTKAGTNEVEARLGDLDLKHFQSVAKWTALERTLISGGWYENVEDGSVHVLETICVLNRNRK